MRITKQGLSNYLNVPTHQRQSSLNQLQVFNHEYPSLRWDGQNRAQTKSSQNEAPDWLISLRRHKMAAEVNDRMFMHSWSSGCE